MGKVLPASLLDLSDILVPQILEGYRTSSIIECSSHDYIRDLASRMYSRNEIIFSLFPFDTLFFSSYEDLKTKLDDHGFSSQQVSRFLNDYSELILSCVFSFPPLIKELRLHPSPIRLNDI